MTNRRPLSAGLSVVPPGADPEAVRAFIAQEESNAEEVPEFEPEGEAEDPSSFKIQQRRRTKAVVPVGLIPVTIRLRPAIAGALKRASLERRLAGIEPNTQQEIVEAALEPWLRTEGVL